MPQMAGNIGEPRLPETQKCMNYRYVNLGIKRKLDTKIPHKGETESLNQCG